jgi:hypothetical protein
MGWNGLDLVNEFSKALGDTTSAFKTMVLGFINDGMKEVATAHQWPFLREKGKVVLTQGNDTHSIVLAKPSAPTVAALAGGALVADIPYKVLVTFYEAQSKVESIAGEESETIIPTGADLSITLSDIAVSTCPLVTARKVYISKNGGLFQYHGTIAHNLSELPGATELDPPTPVTYEITADTSSPITPPEESSIHMLDGDFYLEGTRIIHGTSVQDLIYRSGAFSSSGTPEIWAPINQEEIQVYPNPATDRVASFYYFKIPAKVYALRSSIPQLPSWLYHDLRNYVIWRGYDFRDRAGTESKKLNYDQDLKTTISRKGKAIKRSGRVRSVTPDSDGWVS